MTILLIKISQAKNSLSHSRCIDKNKKKVCREMTIVVRSKKISFRWKWRLRLPNLACVYSVHLGDRRPVYRCRFVVLHIRVAVYLLFFNNARKQWSRLSDKRTPINAPAIYYTTISRVIFGSCTCTQVEIFFLKVHVCQPREHPNLCS
jgi:hypothetical protein